MKQRCEQEETVLCIWDRCTGEEWVGHPWKGPGRACGEGAWGLEVLSKCHPPMQARGHEGKDRTNSRRRKSHQDGVYISKHRNWPATHTVQVKDRDLHGHIKGALKSFLSSVCNE